MKFDELDAKLRVFETANDLSVLPGIFMVARIDGRNFTHLTKETHPFETPFDTRVRDYMVTTTSHLMDCGFRVVYGYTQSDEISLLFHRDENLFGRKLRKYCSVLAGEASARFSLLLGAMACFDCRISQFPTSDLVVDYFRWRSEDAARNALSAHCYWSLRKVGATANEATKQLDRLSTSEKNELLFQRGINFTGLPNWQKRGIGLTWEHFEKQGVNLKTGAPTVSVRRQVTVNMDLPMKDSYDTYIRDIVALAESSRNL
jgi:tRNA(His) guanylyltransferase